SPLHAASVSSAAHKAPSDVSLIMLVSVSSRCRPPPRARHPRGLRALSLPLLQMDQEQRDRRRRHAGDPGSLADVRRPDPLELLTNLVRKPAHGLVVEIRRHRRLGLVPLPLDLAALALDVARVAGVDLERLLHLLAPLRLERLDLARDADARERDHVPV